MSAFIVNRKTIALLTEALVKYDLAPRYHPDAIGQKLWMENIRSYNYRYDDNAHAMPYIHKGTSAALLNDPYTVYKCARCYEYQSCETPDYPLTWAGKVITALYARLEQEIGIPDHAIITTAAYEQAPWGL